MDFDRDFLRRHWIPILLLSASALLPYVQDYRAYVHQWALVLSGENPWMDLGPDRTNTYGPGHVLMALPYALHARLPRIFAAVALVVAVWAALRGGEVVRPADGTPGRDAGRRWLVFLTLYNPLLWISAAVVGHNDVIVALLAVLAVGERDRRPALAGGLIAAAALLKVYPLVLVPFLATDRGRIDARVLAGFAGVTAAGLLVSAGLWGAAPLEALAFGAERPSKFLSLFGFLRGDWLPLGGAGLDVWSVPLLALGLAALGIAHFLRGWRAAEGTAAALLLTFLLYKVGHAQFFVPVILLLTAAFVRMEASRARRVTGPFVAFVAWLSVVVVVVDHLFLLFGLGNAHREWVALPTFLLQTWLLAVWIGTLDGTASPVPPLRNAG